MSLREVSQKTLPAILALSVTPAQQPFVASNAKSIAKAHFHPEAWFRAVYAGEEPVGFLMLHDEHLRDGPREKGFYFLWRLMIDAQFQGKGYGHQALEALIRHLRDRPHAERLLTSCLPGAGSPLPFYLRVGFTATGREMHGEVELERSLAWRQAGA